MSAELTVKDLRQAMAKFRKIAIQPRNGFYTMRIERAVRVKRGWIGVGPLIDPWKFPPKILTLKDL